jgi:hypothetical protein
MDNSSKTVECVFTPKLKNVKTEKEKKNVL